MYALHDNLDRLRAERQLDAAQAASIPHLSEKGRSSWYRHVEKRAVRPVLAAAVTHDGKPALFTVNGKAVDKHGLARWLASQFGSGGSPFADAAPRQNGHANGHIPTQGRAR